MFLSHVYYVIVWHKVMYTVMKVIRHAGVDSRMIILDDQARQQMTLHSKLSLQCIFSPVTGETLHWSDNLKWRVIC